MIKTLDSKGFISRVPRAPRTIRVTVPDEVLGEVKPREPSAQAHSEKVKTILDVATLVLERLVPTLRGVEFGAKNNAIRSVHEALDVALRAAGATEEERDRADDVFTRVASSAVGDSAETRPGRKLAWWRQPR